MKFENYTQEKEYYETQATEEEFLKWYHEQDLKTYETPSLTVDSVMFAFDKEENDLKVLLIKRKANPFKNKWALPGGFVNKGESTDETCLRETEEETGLKLPKENIEQLYTLSTPNRDPRTWVVTVAYLTFLPEVPQLVAGDDALEAQWFSVKINKSSDKINLINKKETIRLNTDGTYYDEDYSDSRLAFDHNEIIATAIKRVVGKLDYQPTILNVLGSTFTLVEARKVYAKFLGVDYKDIDNSNFRKTHGHLFEEVGENAVSVGRPAKLYRLKQGGY